MMTPYELRMLVHYCTSYAPHEHEGKNVPAFIYASERFLGDGLLIQRIKGKSGDSIFEATDKAQFYLQHLCSIPLPAQTFRIPDQPTTAPTQEGS